MSFIAAAGTAALTAGASAGASGLMGKLFGGGGGQQYMQPQWLQNPEDEGAADFRNYNRDYTRGMMQDIQAGNDPMQARADNQYNMERDRIQRENFGQEGDRNNSLWNMYNQQMANSGGFNPAQILAQKKKFKIGMQNQLDDVRERIYGGGTDYMRKASLELPRTANTLRQGAEGQWSAGVMGGQPGGPDMGGVGSMIEKGIGAVSGAWDKYSNNKKYGTSGMTKNYMDTSAFRNTGKSGQQPSWM